MGKRTLLLCLILISVYSYLIAQNSVSFFEEHIDFKLDSKFFSINGIYSFYNNSNEIVNQKIIFPFAVKYSYMENAISFDLNLLPKDTLDINIFYRQKTFIKNTYIITTTRIWGKSLDKAIYTLTIPKKMSINSFSYIPDSISIVDDKKLYIWEKYRFLPQFDFDIVIDKIN